MSETLERNKRNVMAFYELMFNECKPAEAIRTSQILDGFGWEAGT